MFPSEKSKKSPTVLVVDDMQSIRWTLRAILEDSEIQVVEAENGQTALNIVRLKSPDVVVLDIRLPDINGHDVLRHMKTLDSDLPIVMLTGFGDVNDAVQAMKNGAYEYLLKPVNMNKILLTVHRALKENHLKLELHHLSDVDLETQLPLQEIMGYSKKVQTLAAEVARVAPTDFSVLIVGETGVGKEVIAKAIYAQSHRATQKFIAVDCGAIPETLIESELFGHEKGAFTGADRTKPGKFETAEKGTLFLDEISNLPLGMQSKLLRVLQEKCFYRVGGNTPIKSDVRIITATNQYLTSTSSRTVFRSDLYHRLSEYVIHAPSLRERKEDTVFLAKRFLKATNYELSKNVSGFSEAALDLLLAYNWPGNVRELRNIIRRAVLLADDLILPQHINFEESAPVPRIMVLGDLLQSLGEIGKLSLREILRQSISSVEKAIIIHALEITEGNKAQAARMLQIDYKTIHTKVKQYKISTKGENHASEQAE